MSDYEIQSSEGKETVSTWNEFSNRIRLLPWWLSYNKGSNYQAFLKNSITELGEKVGLQDKWLKSILRHAVSEFSKKGLGADYYGYHNIDHELEAAYFTLFAASNQTGSFMFTQKELCYLFVSALFHDYDPSKEFDKPNEDAIERIVRSDAKIRRYIDDVGLDIDVVIALIYRTAYPFKGEIAKHASARMEELFTHAKIPESDQITRKRYTDLGWFLSVAERVAGYALGDFEHAKDLARRNAHALGWHPSVINRNSVKYFSMLKEEKEMLDWVLRGCTEKHRQNFENNIMSFEEAWQKELGAKAADLKLVSVVEKMANNEASDTVNEVLRLYRETPILFKVDEEDFIKTMFDIDSILITLRVDGDGGRIIGYAKGGPLEKYKLRPGTSDQNLGQRNTAYLEGIGINHEYWGEKGGHVLRMEFLNEASRLGYQFVTGYAHRDVISQRINNGESIEIVRKYDPDNLDYYRIVLAKTPDH